MTPEQKAVMDELHAETEQSLKALVDKHGAQLVHIAVHASNIRLINGLIEDKVGASVAQICNDQFLCVFDDVCKKLNVDRNTMYSVASGLHDQIAGFKVQLHQLGLTVMPFAHARDDDDQSKGAG